MKRTRHSLRLICDCPVGNESGLDDDKLWHRKGSNAHSSPRLSNSGPSKFGYGPV